MVGLSRSIKLEWLDKTVELASSLTIEKDIKEKLNEYLSFEIQSPTNLRKTREILLNVWYRPSLNKKALWSEAIKVYYLKGSNKTAIHWAMILNAYPVFSDVCGLIGKICLVQDTFKTSWLREKLLAKWGERTTLFHSTDKILQTLKYLGAIANIKSGEYKVCNQTVSDMETVKVMLFALMTMNDKTYYEISDLSNLLIYFPFKYDISFEYLHNAPEFTISSFGGKMVVSMS